MSFTIPGQPRGLERARNAPGQSRPYTPKQSRAAMKEIARLYQRAVTDRRPLTGAVRLCITAIFSIPASFPRTLRETAERGFLPCVSKPDRDNIEKLVCDALNGLAWCDDAQIVDGRTVKRYGAPARTEVHIEELVSPGCVATPAQKRRDDWVAAGQPPKPRRAASAKTTKSKIGKLPPALQRAVDRAFARDAKAKGTRGPDG